MFDVVFACFVNSLLVSFFPSLQIQLLFYLCSAEIDDGSPRKEGIKIVVIDKDDRTQYDERSVDQFEYNYGTEIDENTQFNHQSRGPDGITYGCYGYLDGDGNFQSKHYIADARGFRVLKPADLANETIEVFPQPTKSK